MSRPRTVFFGSGPFGVASLFRLADHPDVELVGVVTAPPRPAGRKGTMTRTPVHDAAAEVEVAAVLTPERLRAPDAIASVLGLEPELAVLGDYGQLVPRPILELRHGALNLHPSLLPRHRGASPIPATILAGDAETGVTLFRMDEGLDTGPIVAQRRLALRGDETAPELEARLAVEADALVRDALGPWVRGEIDARPQVEQGATLTRPLQREHGRLDPTLGARRLERQIRALQPWPGSFVELPGGRLIVWEAEPLALEGLPAVPPGGVLPGTLLPDNGGLALAVGDGALRLRRVQPAGGRVMSAAELRRGRPSLVGSRVEPAGAPAGDRARSG